MTTTENKESQGTKTAESNPTKESIQILFKVGWDLETFLRRNGLPMTDANANLWLTTSRQASADQLARMTKHFQAGFKTKAKQAATWNKKEGRWDHKETVSVTTPGETDPELLADAYQKAEKRAAKELGEKLQAAIRQGADNLKS